MSVDYQKIQKLIDNTKGKVLEWRRFFHKNPELSFKEYQTSEYIYNVLDSLDHIEVSRPTDTSVIGRLVGKGKGISLALRADIDALPIQEENMVSYASKKTGLMHACGHDGHTAILLGVATVLSQLQEEINGEILFIFQHAEELYPGGARELVVNGVIEDVDIIVGAHLWSYLDVGKVGLIKGPAMAASAEFTIDIIGRGGHASSPHETIDSISIGSQVVNGINQIISRQISPLDNIVLSVTCFNSGTANNIIPDSARISGTVRCFNREDQINVSNKIEDIVKGITSAHDANYKYQFEQGYNAVNNDENLISEIEEVVVKCYGENSIEILQPIMGGEDFSAYQEKVPGAFIFIGARNEETGKCYPHHHPKFDIDERSLEIGLEVFIKYSLSKMQGTHKR